MVYFEFNDKLKVGNKVIDQEHQVLIEYINLLEQAVENETGDWVLRTIFNSLKHYSETHFLVEEELMRAYEYPNLEKHVSAHDGFKKKVRQMEHEYAKGSLQSEIILIFLKNWLTDHILKIDAELAAYLRDNGMA